MRHALTIGLVALALGCAGTPRAGAGLDLDWIDGTWRLEREDGRSTVERWAPVPGASGAHVGVGASYDASGVTTQLEHLWLDERALTAGPTDQTVTVFPVVDRGPRHVRVENAAHDFPVWVRYRRVDDTLVAAIGGEAGAEEPAATWTYERVGAAPRVRVLSAELCDGRAPFVVPPCTCSARVACGDLSGRFVASLRDGACRACQPAPSACERPEAEAGCTPAEVVVIER